MEIQYHVYFAGSNAPGYMPDEPPHPFPSDREARWHISDQLLRDRDDALQDPGLTDADASQIASDYTEAKAAVMTGENVTVRGRHYYVAEDTLPADELRSHDCDPVDYWPVLGDWVTIAELDELEEAGHDVDVLSAQVRDNSDCDWREVPVVDDCGDSWYLGRIACGAWLVPDRLIRADSYQSAYEAWIDARPTIEPDELPDAYGAYDRLQAIMAHRRGHADDRHLRDFCSRYAPVYFAIHAALESDPDIQLERFELVEGYEYQSNATGTGIVDVGYDDRLDSIPSDSECVRFKVAIDD